MFGKANQLKNYFAKVKGYFIKNPGAPFIITFDILMLTCAFLVVTTKSNEDKNNPLVNNVAIFAYCFLVIGVVLQTLIFLRNKTRSAGL